MFFSFSDEILLIGLKSNVFFLHILKYTVHFPFKLITKISKINKGEKPFEVFLCLKSKPSFSER